MAVQNARNTLAKVELSPRRKGLLRGFLRLLAPPQVAVSFIILVIVGVLAIFSPLLAPHNPIQVSLLERQIPPGWLTRGDWKFPLGTDQLGRDVLSRTIHGARISLLVAIPASLISIVLGVMSGLWAGYAGGTVDRLMMRWVDFQRAMPALLVAIVVMTFIGGGMLSLILFLGFFGWTDYARIVRGQVLSLRENVFIEAARAMGAGPFRIMFLHLLPNVVASIIILATFFIPSIIIVESSLSYLGLGVQPPQPSWGNMLADSRAQIRTAPWIMVPPAVALSLTVLASNILGDRLRDMWDPRLRGVQ
ncbi:MAG: ABC transporter permease [Chloroflexi bacterium]|nr:ABC transporter permease [Chloroflexota bacterium]